jgi:UDP-N-acetylglucosamine 1-carboxyvinyltransferase
VIGKRPIDLHLYALKQLGADIREGKQGMEASCSALVGNSVCFEKRSVGATEQAILAAVTAKGETQIINPAKEPEILWLCRYLRTMGAKIRGEGSNLIEIDGVDTLGAGNMQIPPDRIVTGTYICAAAITRSEIVRWTI